MSPRWQSFAGLAVECAVCGGGGEVERRSGGDQPDGGIASRNSSETINKGALLPLRPLQDSGADQRERTPAMEHLPDPPLSFEPVG